MQDRPGWAPPGVDLERPSIARVYDFYLGGSHNFECDRSFARRVLEVMPELSMVVRENRAFLRRAVRYLCAQGIDQFLDLGSGIPTVGNVHEVAGELLPDRRVVYVDHDPIAVAHSTELLRGDDRVAVLGADLTDPRAVLADPVLRGHLDLSRPVAVLLVAVLHFVDDDRHPERLVADYVSGVAPGSYLAISHASTERDMVDAAVLYNQPNSPGSTRLRSRDEIAELFGGLELVEPGLVRMPLWRMDAPEDLRGDPERYPGFAGVGRCG